MLKDSKIFFLAIYAANIIISFSVSKESAVSVAPEFSATTFSPHFTLKLKRIKKILSVSVAFDGPQLPRVLKVLALSSHNLYLSVLYRLSQAICRATDGCHCACAVNSL